MTTPQPTPRGALRAWLPAAIPVALVGLVFWSWALPPAEGRYALLAGEWQATTLAGEPGDAVAWGADASGWQTVRLPGAFARAGLKGPEIVLRRTFDLPGAMQDADLLFVLGYVRDGVVRCYVNGQSVGVKGVYETGFLGSESNLNAFFVPRRLLRPQGNVLALQVHSGNSVRDGITDSRLLLGRQDLLAVWVFHEASVRAFLELGSVLLLLFLAGLVLVLWGLQGRSANGGLYRGTLLLLTACTGYLVTKGGFLITAVLPAGRVVGLVAASVHALGLVIPEFIEAYYLGRVTWFRKLNRVVSGTFLVLTFTVGHTASLFGSATLYQVYVNWLFVLVLYSAALSVRDLRRKHTRFGPLVTTALLLTVGAAVNDLLSDLDVIYTPRLFSLAIANLGIAAAMVVVVEFLQMAEENRRLSSVLTLRNDELADALTQSEESARVKSEFLANTSHELRTPLNAIINIPQGLLEQVQGARRVRCLSCRALYALEPGEAHEPDAACPECGGNLKAEAGALRIVLEPTETARLLGSVVASGKHLLSVVNDILDYSKLDAGRLTLHVETLALNELLDGLRATLEPSAQRDGVTLVVGRLADDLPVSCDRVKVMQVLINLVGNAIKFSDGRGTVTVTPEADTALRRLKLRVRDEGIGIAPEHHAHIFEGFRQVEKGNTRRFGGTGLGLAISRRLVELHGGTLTVTSAAGQGSTFTVELPFEAAAGPDEATGAAATIFVVDDEPSAVDAAAAALRPLGYRVVGVRDPRLVVSRIRAEHPALVVLDVMMPRVSGLDVLRQLRDDPALRATPVLVSSAYPDNRAAAEVLGAAFLAKPWKPGELLAVARAMLAARPAPPPATQGNPPSLPGAAP